MDGAAVGEQGGVSIVRVGDREVVFDTPLPGKSHGDDRFLSNLVALTGMVRRRRLISISATDFLVPDWGFVRDTKGCLAALLGLPVEALGGLRRQPGDAA